MSEIDPEARTGVCANCGPVGVRTSGRRANGKVWWICQVAKAERKRADRYKVYAGDVESILEEQDGCAICHTWEPIHGWAVDHDHECCPKKNKSCGGCVRGVLCHRHNAGLGNFDDDPELLRAAADYLERTKEKDFALKVLTPTADR